jgi:trans-aconitate 2-methyltransferase
LKGFNRLSPVLGLDDYANMMFENGLQNLNISMKVYPLIAESEEELFNFISGSALIPYLERLSGEQKEDFIIEFKKRIGDHFSKFPAIYSFKRILFYGRK